MDVKEVHFYFFINLVLVKLRKLDYFPLASHLTIPLSWTVIYVGICINIFNNQ